MSPVIRRAAVDDAQRILELLLQVEAIHHEGRPDIFKANGTKYTITELYEIMADADRPIFVATVEGTVVGYIFGVISDSKGSSMLVGAKTLHLDDVCIDESYRGLGVGSRLMEYVIEWARKNGCDRMDLDVWEFNDGARRFYEKYGFVTQKRRMDMWI